MPTAEAVRYDSLTSALLTDSNSFSKIANKVRMTRLNDTSSLMKPDGGQSQSPSADNYLTIESLLQSHNDLILAIHKSFNDSNAHINSSIAHLTEEIRQVKTFMHQVVSDRSLKDELVNWRAHTESLIDRSDQNHQREIQRLTDIFERMATGRGPMMAATQPPQLGPTLQQQQQQQQFYFAQLQQQQVALAAALQAQQNVASMQASANAATTAQQPAAQQQPPSALPLQPPANIFHQEPTHAKPAAPKEKPKTEKPKEQPKPSTQGAQAPLSSLDHLKPKAGSWSCPDCMVPNTADVKQCPCCNTAKPGEAAQPTQKTTPTAGPQKSQTVTVKQEMEKAPPNAAAVPAIPIAANTHVSAPSTGSGPFKLVPAQQNAQGTPPNSATGTGPAAQPSMPNFKFCMPSANTPTPPPTTTAVGGAAPSPFSFGSKGTGGSLFGGGMSDSGGSGGGFPGFKPPANTPTTATPPATTGGLGSGTPSLFGGAKGQQQNTFGTFAQKANQGGGFLGGGGATAPAGAPNPTGSSPFGQRTGLFGTGAPRPAGGDGEDEDGEASERPEAFVPDAHYEPVIPLPELVETKTGEEGEEVIFSARCKLYRFDKVAKENKEKGVGEMKILYNGAKKKYRCVMRRDQILKLCANFSVPTNLKISPKEHVPTAYTWACRDYSDLEKPQGEDEILCARFKDADIAKNFAKKMEEAAKGNAGGAAGSGGGGPSPPGGPSGSNGPSKPAGGDSQSGSSSGNGGGAGPKTVPDLISHQKQGGGGAIGTQQSNTFTQWREAGKSTVEKAYEEERGGYEDDVEDADYGDEDEEGAYDEEEEEDQLLYETKCQLQLADEYVSPLKKDAHKPSQHPNCDLALYKSNGVYRVDFTNSSGAGKTVFSHYIYQNSHVGEAKQANGTSPSQPGKTLDYKALNIHSNMAAKRVTVSFADPAEAKDFAKHFGEGAKLAEQIGFDEADDQ